MKVTVKTDLTVVPRIIGADGEVPGWNHATLTFTPDQTDIDLLADRQIKRDGITLPVDGDWVEFADNVVRRISHVWWGNNEYPGGVQTSNGGSWHLHSTGTSSFSGGLFGSVKPEKLVDTGTKRPARFWFFHHDMATAHHAVHVEINVRVWKCSKPAPR